MEEITPTVETILEPDREDRILNHLPPRIVIFQPNKETRRPYTLAKVIEETRPPL
jgi:hypothetical protein